MDEKYSEIPFVAFGNDEIDAMSALGDTVKCRKCRKVHKVEYGERVNADGTKSPSNMLAFTKCADGSLLLVGIGGKKIEKWG